MKRINFLTFFLVSLIVMVGFMTMWVSIANADEGFSGDVTASFYPYHNEYDPSPNVAFADRTVARYALESNLVYRVKRVELFVETHSYFGDSRPQTAYNLNGPHIETYVVKGIGYDLSKQTQLQIASGEHYGGSRYRGETRQWAAIRMKYSF